ncbi:MAG: NAD-dependent deacylase [Muribaculaceae bacterium]|nr:NAD-dependent deacylase [Muribaculaceae bacterium]
MKIVVSSGAGISAESGITTFRDAGGLWENYPVMDVASDEGFARDPALVHRFYNERRAQLVTVKPNAAHKLLAELEKNHDVQIITQNVDDLHERAGSTKVLHLHGELMKVRTMHQPYKFYQLPSDQLTDEGMCTSPDTCNLNGEHVRPHIVFFGEDVPNFAPACQLVQDADVFVVIGTTLSVYPAAALLQYAPETAKVFYIDPKPAKVPSWVTVIAKPATEGVADLVEILKSYE